VALTKSFIREQQKKLEEDRTNLLSQIDTLKNGDPFKDPDHASDNAAIDTDVREQIGHETITAEIRDLTKRIEYIEVALKKTTKGTEYGVCERCGRDIPMARLKFVPEARYCVKCESELVR
jgi:RNA polymerase-binding transcription factor DksA